MSLWRNRSLRMGWGVLLIAGLAFFNAGAQVFTTTTVQGTVYEANGSVGPGTAQISWPAFTTAGNQAVAAGHLVVTIGPDGFMTVNLTPNQGATPAGLYYTVVFHLSDGTTSTEYWVVPAAAQAALGQVRAQVMPAVQAVQAVSKNYVDQSITELTQSLLTSSGGNLSGPLFLSGDPSQPTQAATKRYVDTQTAKSLQLSGGVLSGPMTGTQLGAVYQADQFTGADLGARVQACVNQLDAVYGGTCDARNFTGTQAMGSDLLITRANVTVQLPCATIATSSRIVIAAGTRNVTLHGCASRGASAASGSQGGTVLLYSGSGAAVQVGDGTYAVDTLGFHLDNVVINTTGAASGNARGLAAFRTQELDLESLYLLGNATQTGMVLDGTGNYTGGTFKDDQFVGFGTAVNAVGHQAANGATTDWMNASTFVRMHIDCPTNGGSPVSGTYGINLQQGDGNTFTGGDIEGCGTALHLGANAQNNTLVGVRNENSLMQVVADAGSSYNNWMTGGTMFTGQLSDSGTRNSFLDTFHRSFNGLNGDWYGSQQDATVTNHFRIGVGSGNERGLLNRYQTDAGYRWTTGLSDATAGEQFYQVLDELNSVYRLSIGQYNSGQASSNNQTVINAAGTGAVVLNGSANAGTGGVIFGAGGGSGTTVATVNGAGNAQFNGSLQVGGASTFSNSTTVKNGVDGEIDAFLWAGATANQKESFIYKDYLGASQWYLVKDASNNWALNSALGGLDSFKAYQSSNSGDTYVNAANGTGVVRVNYETGAGTQFKVYGGNSGALYASFTGTNSIQFPGLAAGSGKNCLQVDNSGYLSNTGVGCGTVNGASTGQIAYYSNGTALSGMSSVPLGSGGTGATTAAGALSNLGAQPAMAGVVSDGASGLAVSGKVSAVSATASVNKVLMVMAAPYNAKCDGTTDDQSAIQSAFNDALTNGSSVQFPAGTCKFSTVTWKGQSFFGAGIGVTFLLGEPGQDVFATVDGAGSFNQNAVVRDLTIEVDASVDASATAQGGNNTFPYRMAGVAGNAGSTGTPVPVSNPAVNNGPVVWGGIDSVGYGCLSTATAGNTTFYLNCGTFTAVPAWLLIGKPININGAGSTLSITAWSIVNNVATFTAANALTPGTVVTLGGFGTSTFFNTTTGRTVTSANGSQFTVAFQHDNGSASESGTATLPFTTTVVSVTDATHVVMAAAPAVTVTNGSGSYGVGNNPAWYCGNAGIAIQGTSATAIPLYMNGMSLTNVYFTTANATAAGYNHACGFYMQAGNQGVSQTSVTYRSLWGGYIEAIPYYNNATSEFTPDETRMKAVSGQGVFLPFVMVNGLHRVINGLTVHTLNLPFALGVEALQIPSYLGPTIGGTLDELYFDCWGNNSGEVSRFAGAGWSITGALANCGGGYTELSASSSRIRGGILNFLQIDGNHNSLENAYMNAGRTITNNGIDNRIISPQVTTDVTQPRAYNISTVPPQEPVGILDGAFLTGGTGATPYVSGKDLVTTCQDYRFAFSGGSVSCVNDPTGTEFTKGYIRSTGAGGFGNSTTVWSQYAQHAIGTRYPLTKLYPTILGRCEGSSSCTATILFQSITQANTAVTVATCSITFGAAWTVQGAFSSAAPCLINLSTATYGNVLTWQVGAWSGSPTAVDIATVAYQPYNQDAHNDALTLISSNPVPSFLDYLGDGSDGTLTASGVTNATNEYNLTSLSVPAGSTLAWQTGSSGGPLIFRVSGSCNIAGTISVSVNDSGTTFGGNAGVANGGGTGGGGGGGTLAGSAAGSNALQAPGTAGAASGGTGGAGNALTVRQQRYFLDGYAATLNGNSNLYTLGGTAGGAGGSSGGAGGKGGGAVYLACGSLTFTGTIDASGSAGGNAAANSTGAGGGGGGGFVVMRSPNVLTNTGTINVAGGAGGTCGSYTGCGAGGAGAAGWSKVFSQ